MSMHIQSGKNMFLKRTQNYIDTLGLALKLSEKKIDIQNMKQVGSDAIVDTVLT